MQLKTHKCFACISLKSVMPKVVHKNVSKLVCRASQSEVAEKHSCYKIILVVLENFIEYSIDLNVVDFELLSVKNFIENRKMKTKKINFMQIIEHVEAVPHKHTWEMQFDINIP